MSENKSRPGAYLTPADARQARRRGLSSEGEERNVHHHLLGIPVGTLQTAAIMLGRFLRGGHPHSHHVLSPRGRARERHVEVTF